MTAILIVPGLNGSGEQHWQTWMERSHPEAYRVEQEDWSNPCPSGWQARLTTEILRFPHAVIVAHSLGCALVVRTALQNPDLRIRGALLVAPADVGARSDNSEKLRRFAPLPMGTLPFPAILVASRNDPYMQFSTAVALAGQWGTTLVDAGRSGHINVASGHGPWPAGMNLLSRLMECDGDVREANRAAVGVLRTA